MEELNVDDIFKDFEQKVEDKGEAHTAGEISEEELKRKYQQAEQVLEEKRRKEREAFEEKKEERVLERKAPSKALPNKEKIAYMVVILVLSLYIINDFAFNHLGDNFGAEKEQSITAAAVSESGFEEEDKTDEADVEEEIDEQENAVEEEDSAEDALAETEETLSGIIELTIDKVYTEIIDEEDDLGCIERVVFTIGNGKDKVLTPVVSVYAYDSEMDESWETKSRGEYAYDIGINPGKKHTGSIDLVPKTFRNLDLKKNIRLTLSDTEEGFITVVNDKVVVG
ncbi:hypothetical protein KY347_05865 [Candidatus Woesearchaeota archaeon]|nr:hypothetical protein [Candidatus Woesearchaeota archaeon]